MTGDLVLEANRSNRDLSSLLSVGGGAPRHLTKCVISPAPTKAMPGTGWGMTETNAIGTGIGGQDYLDRPASPVAAVLYWNSRSSTMTATCLYTASGELFVRGTSIFRGYRNRPDANAETFVDGDWMRPATSLI